mmetsp:Transcript_45072/g.134544  ORF Transcript_45072/g.134544 Transcript_45072/m.134544 type:complete len:203 (-) Transcript_45072:668-1276(-)
MQGGPPPLRIPRRARHSHQRPLLARAAPHQPPAPSRHALPPCTAHERLPMHSACLAEVLVRDVARVVKHQRTMRRLKRLELCSRRSARSSTWRRSSSMKSPASSSISAASAPRTSISILRSFLISSVFDSTSAACFLAASAARIENCIRVSMFCISSPQPDSHFSRPSSRSCSCDCRMSRPITSRTWRLRCFWSSFPVTTWV